MRKWIAVMLALLVLAPNGWREPSGRARGYEPGQEAAETQPAAGRDVIKRRDGGLNGVAPYCRTVKGYLVCPVPGWDQGAGPY